MLKKVSLLLCVSVALWATGVQADDLLIVDLSVVDQVTIFATGAPSAATASGSDTTGAYFEGLYGGPGGALSATLVSGDLTNAENPSDGSPSLFRGGSGADPGLNLWSWSSDATVTFTAGSAAFMGVATWTLDPPEYADMLSGSSSGSLYFPADTADDISAATLIGTYSVVVPEPGAMSLIGIGFGLLMLKKRR